MIKKHRKPKVMRRTSRVYLNDLNPGKAQIVRDFLHTCHDVTQYFVDLFWQRQDFSADLADLETVHRGRDRFGLTTRLVQALAKQAKETIRSQIEKDSKTKPQVRNWTVTLYYHFVTVEPFAGQYFDLAVRLIGSGAPRLTLPVHSTRHLNRKLAEGWQLSKSLRLGWRDRRIFVDFLIEKTVLNPKRKVRLWAWHCEERGIRLERKHPAYTSQYCHVCNKWDRRNRRGDRFRCVNCGYSAHADFNSACNLELLGLAGAYGLRSLQSSKLQSFNYP